MKRALLAGSLRASLIALLLAGAACGDSHDFPDPPCPEVIPSDGGLNCANPCDTAGAKRCNGSTRIDTCTREWGSCNSWVAASCPSGQSCMVMSGVAMCM